MVAEIPYDYGKFHNLDPFNNLSEEERKYGKAEVKLAYQLEE